MKKSLLFISTLLWLCACADNNASDAANPKDDSQDSTHETVSEVKGTVAHHSELMQSTAPAESNDDAARPDESQAPKELQIIERPQHLAPDQNEIDSIKAAKLNKKK